MNPAFEQFLGKIGGNARLRLAPTPSGYLHAGNALNFKLNWEAARRSKNGKLLLRIDDLDADRKRPEYVRNIFETLEFLGIDWDEGPRSPADFEENWSQHKRLELYENALQLLRNQGVVFACRKSRKDLLPFGGIYPPEFRGQGLSLDEPDVAWRVKTPPGFPMPDFIVRRRDGVPAYQIGSLVDDVHFRITHIIRGEDLRASTEAQVFLAQVLGFQSFLEVSFFHHPLILGENGEKLSKSAGAAAVNGGSFGGST